MIKIALCDDELQELTNLKILVEEYKESRQTEIQCVAFQSAVDFLESIQHDQYDIIFLDILMPQITGMEVAKEIRDINKRVKIIFLTSSPEFAIESYSVKAYHYTLKPITSTKLFSLLDEIIDSIDQQREETLIIKYKSSVTCLPFFQIEAVEIKGKRLYFYLSDGSTVESAGTLSETEERLLCRLEFIKIHRAFIVNMKCIKSIQGKEITMRSRRNYMIAKSAYPLFKNAYIRYIFEGRER